MKFLVLILVVGLGYLWWRNQRLPRTDRRSAPQAAPQDMVACAHCGVHIPRREALVSNGQLYCSPEHQAQHGR